MFDCCRFSLPFIRYFLAVLSLFELPGATWIVYHFKYDCIWGNIAARQYSTRNLSCPFCFGAFFPFWNRLVTVKYGGDGRFFQGKASAGNRSRQGCVHSHNSCLYYCYYLFSCILSYAFYVVRVRRNGAILWTKRFLLLMVDSWKCKYLWHLPSGSPSEWSLSIEKMWKVLWKLSLLHFSELKLIKNQV